MLFIHFMYYAFAVLVFSINCFISIGDIYMRPLSRRPVSKGHSAKKFRRQVGRTRSANIAPPPMRGGYRF